MSGPCTLRPTAHLPDGALLAPPRHSAQRSPEIPKVTLVRGTAGIQPLSDGAQSPGPAPGMLPTCHLPGTQRQPWPGGLNDQGAPMQCRLLSSPGTKKAAPLCPATSPWHRLHQSHPPPPLPLHPGFQAHPLSCLCTSESYPREEADLAAGASPPVAGRSYAVCAWISGEGSDQAVPSTAEP